MVLAGVVALTVSGCGGDSTAPAELVLSFTAESYSSSQGSLPSDGAQGGAGTITITGGLQAPCLAQASDVKGEAQREGFPSCSRSRSSRRAPARPASAPLPNEALLGNLESGTYQLTVNHVFSVGVGYVALETDVVVR